MSSIKHFWNDGFYRTDQHSNIYGSAHTSVLMHFRYNNKNYRKAEKRTLLSFIWNSLVWELLLRWWLILGWLFYCKLDFCVEFTNLHRRLFKWFTPLYLQLYAGVSVLGGVGVSKGLCWDTGNWNFANCVGVGAKRFWTAEDVRGHGPWSSHNCCLLHGPDM